MIPQSPRKMKRSFDALTYVKPSRRSGQVQKEHRAWGGQMPTMEQFHTPEGHVDSHPYEQPPERQPAFVRARPNARHGVPPRAGQAVIASNTQGASQLVPWFRPHIQRPGIRSEDFYGGIDSSSSFLDGSVSSGSPTVIKTTSVATQANADSAGLINSANSVEATWTQSTSSFLEYPGSSAFEEGNTGSSSEASRRESPALKRFPWQTCVPVWALLMLTSLLTGSAITTVIQMNKMSAPTAATDPDAPSGPKTSFYHAGTVANGKNLFADPQKASPQPPQVGIGDAADRGLEMPTEAKMGQEATGPVAGTDFFAGAPMVYATNAHSGTNGAYLAPLHRATTGLHPPDSHIRALCQDASFTYCQNSEPEYFYSHSANACFSVTDDGVQLCNRGVNKFASKRKCQKNCARRSRSFNACTENVHFSACGREDVKTDLWYFDGDRCALWAFPSGNCPQNDSAVFTTASECAKRCKRREGYQLCPTPQSVPCAVEQLRFPVFAGYSPSDSRIRCLKSSAAELRGHRCLIGPNRFNSTEECNAACRKSPGG